MVVAENRQMIEGKKNAIKSANRAALLSTLDTSAKVISKMAMKKAKVKCGSKMNAEKKGGEKLMIQWRKKEGVFIWDKTASDRLFTSCAGVNDCLAISSDQCSEPSDQLIWLFCSIDYYCYSKDVNFAFKWVWVPHPFIVYRFDCRKRGEKLAHFKRRSFTLAFTFGDICIVSRLVEASITFQKLILIALSFFLNGSF